MVLVIQAQAELQVPVVEAERSNCDDYIIQVHLKDIRYDSLFIRCHNITRTQAFKFSGESTDGSNWKFLIPDSVCRLVPDYFFAAKLKDDTPTIQRRFSFFSCQNGDTVILYNGDFCELSLEKGSD